MEAERYHHPIIEEEHAEYDDESDVEEKEAGFRCLSVAASLPLVSSITSTVAATTEMITSTRNSTDKLAKWINTVFICFFF